MAGPRRSGFRGGGFSRWDRRDVGLRPENALARAAQLCDVGNVAEANQALYEIITDNQSRRRQWSKTYESIMMRLMELSVELRKPAMVKEALHKYRAMCMQSNVSSLDDVVHALVAEAEKRTEKARASVETTVEEGAEDLEESAMETPETLILEAAGHPLTKERVDRQHVVPWMRFLWETYRVVLDIVKTHNKLEGCYHEMATRAFQFCKQYKRFMEFRRLCDMLRQHLNQLITYPRNSPNDVRITDSDTLQKFLETRFTQLTTAVELEHWQEAYRTIEDIHMIISMGMTKTRPQHMSIYYDKLMQVFWVSGNYLYHAHALYKLYTLSVRQNTKLSEDDQRTMASKLLLAALSIPVYDAQSAVLSDSYGAMTDVLGTPMSENAARHQRMASLLGYSSAAERGTLITELISKGVLKACHPELGGLYELLEGEMAPLQFADRIKRILAFVEDHEILKVYTVPVRRVAIFRLLEQLGKVYDVMRMADVKKVASFAEYEEVEDTALTALKTRALSLRFDHQNQCLRFESELFSTDGMRSQLGRLARRMAIASQMLTDKSLAADASSADTEIVTVARELEAKAQARRMAAIAAAKAAAPAEEKKVLQRRELIERQKEEAELRNAEVARQKKINAARELALAREKQKKEEAARKQKEMHMRLQKTAEEAAARAGVGVPGADILEDDATREARMTKEKEAEFRQQAEPKKKAQQYAAHLNHIERALREEQWDLLKQQHVDEIKELSSHLEEVSQRELEEGMERHKIDLADKKSTKHIVPEYNEYMDALMREVEIEFEEWAKGRRAEAEEQRAREEAERLEREEEERREEERLEKERLEEEKRKEEEEKKNQQYAARERLNSGRTMGGGYRPGMLSAMRAEKDVMASIAAPSLKSDIQKSNAGSMSVPVATANARANAQSARRDPDIPVATDGGKFGVLQGEDTEDAPQDTPEPTNKYVPKRGGYVPPGARAGGGGLSSSRPPMGSRTGVTDPRYSSSGRAGGTGISDPRYSSGRSGMGSGPGSRTETQAPTSSRPGRPRFINSKKKQAGQ